jgi:hypothetical protein
MVLKKKIKSLRKRRSPSPTKARQKKPSPDWENIYDMGLKKYVKELYQKKNIKAWDIVSRTGEWKDAVKKFLDKQPKISKYWKTDTAKHALVMKPKETQEFARKDMAELISQKVYYSEHAKRWYAKGRQGAIKSSEAKELITDASKELE